MPLSAGDRLGPYEVLGLLGKGGMGEVYRARDPKLEREVAIKVLPAALAQNPDRLARFEREAKILAALNHPNIATIYGREDRAIVMELVEGPTLAQRLKSGPLPIEETVAICQQIIAALEAAHEKGVVHRDLKPANVKAPVDAPVKVLDFGLATAVQASAREPGDGHGESPTLTMGATEAGVILGTAAYMSPEQAAGKQADKRADIWSFGVVLYEMLTGKPLFGGGESVSHILADVLRAPVDFEKIPQGPLRELLRRCLDRDVKTRLRDIGEARVALARPPQAPAVMPGADARVSSPAITGGAKVAWAVAAVAMLAALATAWAPWRAEPERPLVRLEVDLGADVALPAQPGGRVILSPDGTRLVYVAGVAGASNRLYTRRLDQAKATELPGTEGAQRAFFSPDGQWVGFTVANKLNKISVEGGAVVPLGDIQISAGEDWGEDGSILVGGVLNNGMRRIPSSGGELAKLTDLGGGEIAHGVPQFLPGGKFALFSVFQQAINPDTNTIESLALADGKRKVLVRGATLPRFLPSGHLVYVNKSTLFAVRFDPEKLETQGNAVPILDDVKFEPQSGLADLSFSRNGTLVYRKGGAGAASNRMTMEWIDAAGKRSPLISKAGVYTVPRLSPDAKRLALSINEGGSQDVWVYDPQRDAFNKLTFGGAFSDDPVWSPDGRYIVFSIAGAGISWVRADGGGQPARLIEGKGIYVPSSFSPDGKRLAFFEVGNPEGWIFTVEVTEENGQLKAGKSERFFPSKFIDGVPEFSFDGRWIAYQTNESGRNEVVVRAFPAPASGQGGKWLISTNGGTQVRWSRNSPELLYQEGDRIMAVGYTVNGDTFVADKPRVRVEKLGGTWWDVAPDGRIAVLKPVETPEAPAAEHTVVFLQNFFDELRRRVPVK